MSTKWRLFLSIVTLAAAIYFVSTEPIQQGLDLKGGTQVVLDLKPRPGQQVNADLANRTLEVLRRRVDSLGVTEPSLEIAGERRIIVELPGVSDPEEAVRVIGSTAQLSFHSVEATLGQAQPTATTTPTAGTSNTSATTATTSPAAGSTATTATTAAPSTPTTAAGLGAKDSATVLGQAADPNTTTSAPTSTTATTAATSTTATSAPTTPTSVAATTPTTADPKSSSVVTDDNGVALQLGPQAMTGDAVDTANAQPPDQAHSGWYIDLKFKNDGSKVWADLTGKAACNASGDPKRQVAIVLDNRVISHPEVATGGSSPIQCNVGITGGTTEISGGFTQAQAKNLALLIRGGALPVDVSVASQQVVGPELGKSAIEASRNAVIIGGLLTIAYIFIYYRVLGLLAGLALASYGVISYAVLVGLNVTLTLPGIAGFVLAVAMAMDSNVLVYERTKEELAGGRSMRSAGQIGFKNALSAILDSNATTFIAAATLYFFAVGEVKGFGVTLLIGTAASIFTTLVILRTLVAGLLSMEWARSRPGMLGMNVGAKFRKRMAENPPDVMSLSKYFLTATFLVLAVSLAGVGVRGINYGIEFTGGRMLEYHTAHPVDLEKAREEIGKLGFPRAVVQRSGTEDTSVRVPDISKEQVTKVEEVMKNLGGNTVQTLRDEKIGPSFGQELKRNAYRGLIIGIAAQLIYVAIRFRWNFGIGAVVAMVHDVLLVLGLFAWLQKPFDAVFLAAMLTIIAFSVNDSVVVFDRIREQRRRRVSEPFARVVSDACAQTFPRTLNIGISALFILGALFFFGGQTLGDFALALMIGVITGVYSSVFVASPVAVLLERWKPDTSFKGARGVSKSGANARKAAAKAARSTAENTETEGSEATQEAAPKPSSNRPAPRPRKKKKRR